MKPVFIGSGVALITPFDKDGKIDFRRFEKLIEYHIENKTDAIIVCGTTGEGSTLTVYERLKLFSVAVDITRGRVPVIGGTGSNSTSFSLSLMKEAEKTGIDAHLSVTPYYNKTSQDGLIKHYYTLAEEAEKPIMVYNVPSRTGMNITPETYQKLSLHNNICAVKEADSNIAKLIKSIRLCEGRLHFYIGNDDMICPAIACGCKGVISVLANIMPGYTHEMAAEGLHGNTDRCRDMQLNITDTVEALFCDVNPIPVKYAMKQLNMDTGVVRLPLTELTQEKQKKITECIVKIRI
ncbi:MAG: 4-hydroxy-tetrahydrodipicolinate synthase [Clostridia bacterium]|nr:4-hydroxy-tetrahydrodipicolinate synthase [Clostridia bacterium]